MSNLYLQAVAPLQMPSTRKFVLFVLADMASDDGTSYASIAHLIERTCLAERAVQIGLSYLEEMGILERDFRRGRSTHYRLTDPACWKDLRLTETPAPDAPPQEMHHRTTCTDTPAPDAPAPACDAPAPAPHAPISITQASLNPKIEPKTPLAALAVVADEPTETPKPANAKKPPRRTDGSDEAAAAGWSEFWGAYPRGDGKKAARKAWNRIAPDDPLQARMLAAIALQCRSDAWRKEGGKYIPHAATWLNGERWTDSEPKPGAIGALPMTERERLQQQLANTKSPHERLQINYQLAMLKGDGGAVIEGSFLEAPTLPGHVPRDRRSDDELLAEMLRSRLPPPASKALATQEDDA